MSKARENFTIYKPLEEFKGSALMIGCGDAKQHYFQITSKPIESKSLHPCKTFYHVSLSTDYSDEGNHDLEGNFLDDKVINYLSKKKYDLICFETVTEIFVEKNSAAKAIQNAKKLLSDSGVCFIFFGGRSEKSLDLTISQFNYSYSFTYGIGGAWSLIGADSSFDLLQVINQNSYLNHMNCVIKNKFNLNLSYNYYESGLKRHLKTSSNQDDKIVSKINPFVSQNGFWSKYKKINLALQDLENEVETALESTPHPAS